MAEEIIYKRTIAISAIYELALNIKNIAWHGLSNSQEFDALLKPLLQEEDINKSILDVYDDENSYINGLKEFQKSLLANNSIDREINRYVFSLIHLAKKLNENPNMLSYIARELDHIRDLTGQDQVSNENDNFYSMGDEHIVRQLANIYQSSISKLGPRILINGKSENLSQEKNAQSIRALLLSGVRSAILWNRNGGSRLKLLFMRKAYLDLTHDLLKN